MFYTIFLIPLAMSTLYDPLLYSLGSNILINSDFNTPNVPSPTQFLKISSSIVGWNCTHTCQVVHVNRRCAAKSISCTVSFVQGIDLLSSNVIDHYTQDINILTAGKYYLSLLWMPPLVSPIGQVFGIIINSTLIQNVTVTDANYIDHLTEVLVDLHVGVNTLDIIYYKTGPDSYGVYVGQINLQQLIPIPQPPVQSQSQSLSSILGPLSKLTQPLLENATRSMNKLPGNRIFSYTLTNFLSVFDRLQFYFYHKHNLTYYSNVLLSNANQMALERGSLPQELMENCDAQICNSVTDVFDELTDFLDKKRNYTDSQFFSKNPNGMGFFANNLEFFFYQLPMVLGTYFLFLMIFKALFNYRISKYVRKYAFYGILLFILYEGNVEQFAFYFFSECQNLFSSTFSHKIANVIMIYFFFILMVFSIGGLLFFSFHYRKLVKYFLEDSKQTNMGAVVIESLERAVFPLLFGAVHAILLEHLFIQTIVLFIVEGLYLTARIVAMRSIIPLYKFKVTMCITTSLIRLCFIVTFYLYEINNYPSVINLIHKDLVIMYLISWLVEFLHDIGLFIWDIKEAVSSTCKGSKQSKSQKGVRSNEKKKKLQKAQTVNEIKIQKERPQNSIMKKQSKFNTDQEAYFKKQKELSKTSKNLREKTRPKGIQKKQAQVTFNAGTKQQKKIVLAGKDIRKLPGILILNAFQDMEKKMKKINSQQ